MKLSSKGVFCTTTQNPKNSYFSLDSFTDSAIDPVGAGDALLAYSSLALKSSNCLLTASIIGSFAAALECNKDGNEPIKANEVISFISSYFEKLSIN